MRFEYIFLSAIFISMLALLYLAIKDPQVIADIANVGDTESSNAASDDEGMNIALLMMIVTVMLVVTTVNKK